MIPPAIVPDGMTDIKPGSTVNEDAFAILARYFDAEIICRAHTSPIRAHPRMLP